MLPWLAAAAWILWFAAYAVRKRESFLPIVLLASTFALCGALTGAAGRLPQRTDDLRVRVGDRPRFVRVRGFVREGPRPLRREGMRTGEAAPYRFLFRVEEEYAGREWRSARGLVQVDVSGRVAGAVREPARGDAMEIAGGLRLPPRSGLPGCLGAREFLAARGIHYRLRCTRKADLVFLPGKERRGPVVLRRVRDALRRRITAGLEGDPVEAGLLAAILLGYRREIPADVWDPFTRAGAMHIFAISGLHVGLLVFVLDSMLRFARIPRRIRPIVVLPAMWFYVVMTGARTSAVRAFLMAAAIVGGRSFNRPLHALNALGLAALAILAVRPLQLFDVGFQLSFAVVISLVLVTAPVQRRIGRVTEPDPYLAPSLVDERRRRIRRWSAGPIALGSASLAAWIGATPIGAAHFHLVPVVALAGNLVVIPLASLVVAIGLASLVGGWIWSEIGITFNHANRLAVALMARSVEILDRVPGGHFYVREFPGWLTAFCYGSVLLWLFPGRNSRRVRVGVAISILVLAAVGMGRSGKSSRWEATFPALRGGESVFVDGPGGADMLVDTGPSWSAEPLILRMLRVRGVDRLRSVVLTHPDGLHVGGTAVVRESVPVDSWAAPRGFGAEWERRGIVPSPGEVADGTLVLRGRRFRAILAARGGMEGGIYDQGAAAVLVEGPDAYVLLTSDAPASTVLGVLERIDPEKPLILQLPRHGRWDPGIPAMLDRGRPLLCVAVTGRYESESSPDPRTLEAVESRAIPWLATHRAGTIVLRFEAGVLEVECWRTDRGGKAPDRIRFDLPHGKGEGLGNGLPGGVAVAIPGSIVCGVRRDETSAAGRGKS